MKVAVVDRRIARRHSFEAPLRVRIWKSAIPEQRAESENLSEDGMFFATDSLLRVGTTVEILLKIPEEITGEPTTEWLCTGHVVRVEPANPSRGKFGVGVQFDCYRILRPRTPSDLGMN
jgi:PilZ domain